jgi:hypothetical protein
MKEVTEFKIFPMIKVPEMMISPMEKGYEFPFSARGQKHRVVISPREIEVGGTPFE